MTISALPSAPLVTDSPATFNSKAFAWVGALDAFVTQANSVASESDASAAAAAGSAVAAASSASTASSAASVSIAAAGVTQWVSGATYSIGNMVWSPTSYQSYRRKTAGAGTTDPVSDSANWSAVTGDLSNAPALGNPTLGNTDLKNIRTATFYQQLNNATTSGAITIDWSAAQNHKQAEPTGGITYTFTAPPGPCHLQLFVDSDGSSTAQTFTWPGSVIWMGAQWAAIANKKAIINFWYDGTNYYAVGSNQV